MENATDTLAQFGLDAIDLRWTLMDIAANEVGSSTSNIWRS
jgi:hypothetical protein